MAELIVADTSPLIVLARIRHLKTLALVAGKVIVPDAIAQECSHDPTRPGAHEIENAFSQGWLSRQPQFLKFEPVSAVGLGPGETAAIGLALSMDAPILIDERLGRQVAMGHRLKIVGTLGILLRAKERGLINSVKPLIDALSSQGFFVAAGLAREVLRRAGEPFE